MNVHKQPHFERVSLWEFTGQGYLDLDQAAAAVLSATHARIRAHQRKN